jgi:hypothetical protein
MSPIANYSTTVTALKSIGEIQGMLVAHGAKQILTAYDDKGAPVGLAFIVATPYGEVPFRLPANIDRVEAVLLKQLTSSRRQWDRDYQEQRRAKIKEQAGRVAWRILKDWVRAQMAILEAEMVSIDQIFLPYMQGKGGKTLYEVMRDHHFQLPEGGK